MAGDVLFPIAGGGKDSEKQAFVRASAKEIYSSPSAGWFYRLGKIVYLRIKLIKIKIWNG